MIGRFLRRPAPPARVTHFTPRQYLLARAGGRGMVRIELPSPYSPAVDPCAPGDGGAAADLGRPANPSDPAVCIPTAKGPATGPSLGTGSAAPRHPQCAAPEPSGNAG